MHCTLRPIIFLKYLLKLTFIWLHKLASDLVSPLEFQIIIITQTLVRSDCAVCVNMSLIPALGAQNPSNSQKQQRRERRRVSVAVMALFIAILESVKSVIIRGRCHRRNETDGGMFVCIVMSWLTYLCESEGRPWHHVNTEQCHHKLSLRHRNEQSANQGCCYTDQETAKGEESIEDSILSWIKLNVTMSQSICHNVMLIAPCHTHVILCPLYKTTSVECASAVMWTSYQGLPGRDLTRGLTIMWKWFDNVTMCGVKTWHAWHRRVPRVITVTCHMSSVLTQIRQCLSSSELLPSSDLSSPSSLRSLLWFWTSLLLLFSGPSPPSSLSQARWCSLQYRPSSLRAKKSPAVSFFPQATHTKHCRVADNFISSRYTLF